MRNKLSSMIWGILFIIVGFGFIGNAMDWWNFSLFFDGWWTLFIIIPSIVAIMQNGVKPFSMSAFIVGVLLLLSAQDYLNYDIIQKLLVPIIFIVIGVCILLKAFGFNNVKKKLSVNDENKTEYCAIFSGQTVVFNDNEVFNGAEMNAVFGSVKLDLRAAIINEDVAIDATAVFGGVDIFLPGDVDVRVSGTPIFGGISNKKKHMQEDSSKPMVYVNAISMFGGVDIK